MMKELVRRCFAGCVLASLSQPALGQGGVAPGTREIFALSFANAQPGQIPAGLRLLGGSVEVVDKDGVRMLRARGPAEFLVTLPEALPTDFTLEFDLIAKQEGPGDDLAFEGTARRSLNSAVSAEVHWSPTTQTVSGGGLRDFTATTPASLSEMLRGQLAKIRASFEGNTLRLYTNGVRLYTLTDRLFVRGTVLRVTLGGQSEENAVYLARLRVAVGAASTVVATQQPLVTGTTSQSGGTIQAVGAAAPAATITPLPAAPPPASAGAVSQGPVVTRQSSSRTGVAGAPTLPPPAPSPAPGLAARTISLSGFAVVGLSNKLAPRTVTLSGFTAVGDRVSIAPKTALLSGFTAAGTFGPLAPRTITLSGFRAAGDFVSVASKTITLSGFTAAGTFGPLARTVLLSGFTAMGEFTRLPPRTITLSGFTAVGITP